MTATSEAAHLKITLDDVEPAMLRRIEVPLSIRLDRLHAALQAALGWKSRPLWEFRARYIGSGIPDPSWEDSPHNAVKTTLRAAMEQTGVKSSPTSTTSADGWENTTKVERIGPAAADEIYPCLVEATGCAVQRKISVACRRMQSSSKPSLIPTTSVTRN